MDNFLAMERKGRDLFKSLLEDGNITKYKESTGRYNPVDFYLIHNEDKIVAEIKCRDVRYVNYPTHLMETEKLKSLLAVKDTHDCKAAWYVNFFGEDICFIYNADKVKNLCELREQKGYSYQIQVDGSINDQTAIVCKKAGADIFVSGSYIFGGNIEERIHKIMDAGEEM